MANTVDVQGNTSNTGLANLKLADLKQKAKQLGIHGYSAMRKTDLIQAIEDTQSTVSSYSQQSQLSHSRRSAARLSQQEQHSLRTRLGRRAANGDKENNDRVSSKDKDKDGSVSEFREGSARKSKGSSYGSEIESGYHEDSTDIRNSRKSTQKKNRNRRAINFEEDDNSTSSPRESLYDDARERHDSLWDENSNFDQSDHLQDSTGSLGSIDSLSPEDEISDENEGDMSSAEERRRERRSRRRDKSRRNRDKRDRRNRDSRENDSLDEGDEDEIYENNTNSLLPVAGIVDILDSYAFVRTSGYLPGTNDVYVSMSIVKKYGLRKGDAVQGTIKAPHENDHRNSRQKLVPLQGVTSINGLTPEESLQRPQFSKLTPLYPNERLKMETTAEKITGRIIDIVDPIGKGQRGLIVAPPKAGKTATLQAIANSIAENNPECHLMVVLVDERPEEVTDMERTVRGEVISSTFDQPATNHTIVAELAIERAKRLVELGKDVVLLLDSMTRLARAYNLAQPASGRVLSGGVDAQALYPPKKFFGAARNIENGGSLTIIATALVETGSKMDEVIFEEFKGTGNMELRLSRELANKRLFPAIDINSSGTRREELITPASELVIIYRLRRLLGALDVEQAYQTLVPRLKQTSNNEEFFKTVLQSMKPAASSNS